MPAGGAGGRVKDSVVKKMGWWTCYVALLMLTSGILYRLESRAAPPALSLISDSTGFGPDGSATLSVRISRPARRRIEVPFVLGGDAVRGRDYELSDPTGKAVIIPPGRRTGTLKLEKKPPSTDEGDPPSPVVTGTVVVSLEPTPGLTLDPARLGSSCRSR